MNAPIQIYQNTEGEQRVSARYLYKSLEVKKDFSEWFETNSKQLVEPEDYTSILSSTVVNNVTSDPIRDYLLKMKSAKHIASISGTEKGKEVYEYLIEVYNKIFE